MTDLNSGNLPAFSMILPDNEHNMHNNNVASGDTYAQSILDPLLNSQAYANGDLAIFFLWDEDTPIPNVLLAPSVIPGTRYPLQREIRSRTSRLCGPGRRCWTCPCSEIREQPRVCCRSWRDGPFSDMSLPGQQHGITEHFDLPCSVYS